MENGPINDPDTEFIESPLTVPEKSWFHQNMCSFMEKSAGTSMGQFFMELADQSLKIMEETTKWSVPQGKIQGKYGNTIFKY